MKKALLIIGMIVIFFAGCRKDDVLEASKVEMKDVTMERGWEHIKMSGEYSYPQALEGMKIYVSINENMSESVEYVCALEGKKFDVTIDNLEAGVTYYYRYEYDNGYDKVKGDKENFVTVGKPIVVTKDVGGITNSSAVLSGSVTNNDAANKIKERGFCWGKNPNPTISGSHNNNGSSSGTGTSSFTYNLTNLTSGTKYYVRTYIVTDFGTLYGEEKSFVTKGEEPEETISGTENGHNYVDLGLPSGLKWATCNVGATSPEKYGNYYAWGEISTKTEYTEANCTTHEQNIADFSGNTKYDVAAANWGGNWRIPTVEEFQELLVSCTWEWCVQGGVNGHRATGPNGNKIFLPAAGSRDGKVLNYESYCAFYWSSTPNNLNDAFSLGYENANVNIYYGLRHFGESVRPVFGGNFEGPGEQPEEPEIVLPTVTTSDVTNITSNSATCGGNVTSDGNGTVTARGICWSTSQNPTINNNRSIDGTGTGNFTSNLSNLVPQTTYYVRAYATNEAGTSYGAQKSFTTLGEEPEETISGTENGHNYVDLGLPSGLKWATCNVGASKATDYGDYYAWGETTTKTEYTEDNSLTYGRQMNDISGNAQYDVATANWGGEWRMPKSTELKELIDNCTWTWTTQNGVNGYKVIGTNGNSIFLPAAGLYGSLLDYAGSNGSYWSSTPIELDVNSACDLIVSIDVYSMLDAYRYLGRSVRPVFGGNFEGPEEQPEETISGTENGHNYVDLGLPSGLKWATCNVGASSSGEYGDYFAWGETTTKSEYTIDNSLIYGCQVNDISGNAQYDAATANWGGDWRMPTYDELLELEDNCIWTWITHNGVNGHKIEGPNGNSIFIPAAGYREGSSLDYVGDYGYYWSSMPYGDYGWSAYVFIFHSYDSYMNGRTIYYGHPVRPVFGGDFTGPEEQPEEPETPSANQTFNVNGVTFTMIAVEGGTFQMGATSEQDSDANSDEKPVHNVTLSDYYIGETEVTQELWEAVVGSNPSKFSGYPQRPVEYVSWNDCQEFITKLNQLTGKNFRLPTEAEWEYAARGGNRSKRYKYSGSNTIGDVAWYTDNSSSRTHDVKTKQANGLGIYDMSGNVYEWCQDWYGDYSSSPENNPTGPATGSYRVLRGASWDYGEWSCRVSCRLGRNPAGWSNSYGFRLAL